MSENIQVPKGWEVKKLGEVVEKITQKNTLNCDNILTISAQYGLINQKDFFNKKIASNDTSGYYLINKNDFAYNKSYSIDYPYGAIKRLTLYNTGVVSTLYICFRFINNNIDIMFMEQYFEIQLFNKYIYSVAQEGARNHGLLNITNHDFFNMPIPVPPLEEQKKIAEILSLWDKAIEQTKDLIAYKEKQKKGLMQALLTGKKRLNGFTDEWKTTKLGEVANFISGYSFSSDDFIDTGITLIKISNINNEKIEINSDTAYLPLNYAKKYEKFLIKHNDLLIAMSGATTGKMGVYKLKNQALLNQRVGIIRAKENYNQIFLIHILKMYVNKILEMAYGGAQPNISANDINKIKLNIPTSLDEQKAIAEILSSADEEIELLNKQLELYTEQKKGLMQNLLTGKVRV